MARHLDSLIANANKSGKPLAFVIMDIDYFKLVNDRYGCTTSVTRCSREFSKRIAANTRGIDLACRHGGEEFVVVMPGTDISFAYSVSERLRQSIETTPIAISREPGQLNITISIGTPGPKAMATPPDALLHRADQALYRAKRSGRNRVRRRRGITTFTSSIVVP